MLVTPRQFRLVLFVFLALGLTTRPALAQPKRAVIRTEGGGLQVIEGAVPGQPVVPGQPNPNAKPGDAKPGDPNKPADPNAPKEGDKKKDGPSPLTTRPAKPQRRRTPTN